MSNESPKTDKLYLTVHLSDEQLKKLFAWEKEQDEKVVAKQKGTRLERYGTPYYGAIGGSLTFHITATGLGQIVKVSNNLTGDEIDLTEYDMW